MANLLRNTIEQGRIDIPVIVEALEGEDGFSLGEGIVEAARTEVFDWHQSTKKSGTGIGFRSVKQITDVHG